MKKLITLPLFFFLVSLGRIPTAPIGNPAVPPGQTAESTPQATGAAVQPDTGPFWSQGQIWADTTSAGYCPGYVPYESSAAPPALSWPVPGGTLHEGRGFRIGHTGTDIDAPIGSPVTAAASGYVVWAGETDFFGNDALVVAVEHGGGWHTVYAHLSAVLVDCGQGVNVGDVIGEVGMSGAANFSHAHFDLRNGRYSYEPLFSIP
jgi:murein DD-endopeptidase MepM/ murein hydrolase activator NlpD